MLEPELRALLARHNVDMDDVRTLLAIWRDPASSPMDQASAISALDEVNLACVLEELHPAYLAQRAELERLRELVSRLIVPDIDSGRNPEDTHYCRHCTEYWTDPPDGLRGRAEKHDAGCPVPDARAALREPQHGQ